MTWNWSEWSKPIVSWCGSWSAHRLCSRWVWVRRNLQPVVCCSFAKADKMAAAVGFLHFMLLTLYALPLLSVDMGLLRTAPVEDWGRCWKRQRVA